MNYHKAVVPFGMMFEEESSEPTIDDIPAPCYDPLQAISFVVNELGERVPFVTWGWTQLGATKTGTSTRTKGDEEDTDILAESSLQLWATKTATKSSGEQSDND